LRHECEPDACQEQHGRVFRRERGAEREADERPRRDARACRRRVAQRVDEGRERERPAEQQRRIGRRDAEPDLRERHARDDRRRAKSRTIAAQLARDPDEHDRCEQARQQASQAKAECRVAQERGAEATNQRDDRRVVEIPCGEMARPRPVVALVGCDRHERGHAQAHDDRTRQHDPRRASHALVRARCGHGYERCGRQRDASFYVHSQTMERRM